MDEVLLSLAKIAIREENTADASANLWKLVCNYPASKLTGAAFEELWRLGSTDWRGCEKFEP